jgi:hypothetical protein
MIDQDPEKKPQMLNGSAKEIFRVRIIAMAMIVSMGGVRMTDGVGFLWLMPNSSSSATTLVKFLVSWRCQTS